MNDTSVTLAKLTEATQAVRADFVARYIEGRLSQLNKARAELAAANWDMDVVAPPPKSTMDKWEYRSRNARIAELRCWFKAAWVTRWPHEPNTVVEREGVEDKLRAQAIAEANACVDSYLAKMAKKIGKEALAIHTNGNIWEHATVTAMCADGELQHWRTTCILNVSCLGKLFNQWPTRRIKQ